VNPARPAPPGPIGHVATRPTPRPGLPFSPRANSPCAGDFDVLEQTRASVLRQPLPSESQASALPGGAVPALDARNSRDFNGEFSGAAVAPCLCEHCSLWRAPWRGQLGLNTAGPGHPGRGPELCLPHRSNSSTTQGLRGRPLAIAAYATDAATPSSRLRERRVTSNSRRDEGLRRPRRSFRRWCDGAQPAALPRRFGPAHGDHRAAHTPDVLRMSIRRRR